MNAELSGEVKHSVSIEMQQPLSLHFLPVVCILICTFSYSGERWSHKTEANFPLVYRASLLAFTFDFSKLNNLLEL